jgi:hypothetical protein
LLADPASKGEKYFLHFFAEKKSLKRKRIEFVNKIYIFDQVCGRLSVGWKRFTLTEGNILGGQFVFIKR